MELDHIHVYIYYIFVLKYFSTFVCWKILLRTYNLRISYIVLLCSVHWCNLIFPYSNEMSVHISISFSECCYCSDMIIRFIWLSGATDVSVDHNCISPWWQSVRSICSKSQHISAALLAAVVSKSVAIEMANGEKVDLVKNICLLC